MDNKVIRNKKNVNAPFIAFSFVFGALALSAVIVFWVWQDAEWVKVYQMVMRWFILPLCALVASYAGAIKKEPKGLMWSCPVAFGLAISLVEYLTYSLRDLYAGEEAGSLSVVLIFLGAFASLFGFTFAKMDRAEKAREARAAKKRAEKAKMEETEAPAPVVSEHEYNPSSDFIPDENDTWAEEVLAEEGYGEVKVDYAEPDSDFSIDSPDEAEFEAEEAIEEHIEDEHTEENISEEIAEDAECIDNDSSENEELLNEEESLDAEETIDQEGLEAEEISAEDADENTESELGVDEVGTDSYDGEETLKETILVDENTEE